MARDPTELRRLHKAWAETSKRYLEVFNRAVAGDLLARDQLIELGKEMTTRHNEFMKEAVHFSHWK